MKKYNKCIICKGQQNFIFSYQNHQYYRCVQCTNVSTYPIPDLTTITAHYKKKFESGNYKLLQVYKSQYLSIYKQLMSILEEELMKRDMQLQNKKVLDIGCFTGDFLQLLQQKNADVYGVELQKDAVRIANKKLPGRIYQADIMSFKFPQKNYDIITLLGLIEHVSDPAKLIKRSYELLNKNGVIMIQTPNSSSFLAKTMKKYWPPYSPIEHIHLFSRKGLENTLTQLGFKEISFRQHRKKLPIGYVYNMFNNFGPEFHKILKPLDKKLNNSNIVLPFYIGEMIITASKK